ncbi:hypothetical protein DAEQUDRAFT_241498 [Daedalea quercina L-15889]|uniref:Fanconi-associated nuclease n=1 Tax=Daedalea quercina L-15889 TaxID=1314783 RepID=A0A165QR67_9APHY|nr:hypothetical protein DAEQUDRAFT_241498 [Daedalea quercina L-15889]
MLPKSPTVSAAAQLVFGSSLESESEGIFPVPADSAITDGRDSTEVRVSMYVSLFEDMVTTVLRNEHYLFTLDELGCLSKYSKLSYHARYLLVRLCLRKSDKWHRLSTLKYEGELGKNIRQAIAELCGKTAPLTSENTPPAIAVAEMEGGVKLEPLHLSQDLPQFGVKAEPQEALVKLEVHEPNIRVEGPEIIDPTMEHDGQSEPAVQPMEDDGQPGPSQQAAEAAVQGTEYGLKPEPFPRIYFAEDESEATLRDLLECLTVNELKGIAKQFKVKGNSKDLLMDDLIRTCSGQVTLGFFMGSSKKRGKDGKAPLTQSNVFLSGRTQADRLRAVVMKTLDTCVRVNEQVVKLLRRINLIYFRKTQQATSLLTESILAYAKKRSYTSYSYARTHDIWPSRAALLAYEDALEQEAQVDEILDGTWSITSCSRSTASRTPGPPTKRVRTPTTPSNRDKNKAESSVDDDNVLENDSHEPDGPSKRKARALKPIFQNVYEWWQSMVCAKGEEDSRPRGLERFDCGHVLTRVVCKGSTALGMLGEHEHELEVLENLLAQRRWRRGRRGRWYERRALLLMKFKQYDRAKEAVIEALEDDDTHIVFRPKLERRLTTLEKRLKVPDEERHTCEGKLEKAAVVQVVGVRVYHRETSLKLDPFGRNVNKASESSAKGVLDDGSAQRMLPSDWVHPASVPLEKHPPEVVPKWTGKSIWIGRDGEEVTVEALALQHYESQGYRGFHCEGRIVTTLFGLLFWDIIFADIPGAFETPYQHAPLDIAEDTFYYARQDLIDQRLEGLKAGRGPGILERVFDEHAERKTCP